MKDLLEVWIISIGFCEIFNFPRSCCATLSQSRRCLLSLILRCLAWVTPPRDSLVMSHDKITQTYNFLLYVVIYSMYLQSLMYGVSCNV